jgi:hypothetical protein
MIEGCARLLVEPIDSVQPGIPAASLITTRGVQSHVGAEACDRATRCASAGPSSCTLATSYAARASPIMTTRPKTVE